MPRGAIRLGLVGAAVVLAGALLSARYAGSSKHWDWAVGAEVGTALGTTLLAFATFVLAYGVRKPRLSLRDDEFATHSRVEGNEAPYLRLMVWNDEGRRAATGTRVLVQGYRNRDADTDQITIGSPSLGWPSAQEAVDESVVIFGGSGRPLDFGELKRVKYDGTGLREQVLVNTEPPSLVVVHRPDDPESEWHFKPGIGRLAIADQREWLVPGRWTVRLLVGADDADARYYDVDIEWDGSAADPQAALDSVTVSVRAAT